MLQLPVLTTLKAKSSFPEDHPLSLGVRGEPAEHFLRGLRMANPISESRPLVERWRQLGVSGLKRAVESPKEEEPIA